LRRKIAVLAVIVLIVAGGVLVVEFGGKPGGGGGASGGTVLLVTSLGNVTIELYDDMPITTSNFKNLTKMGLYDNTIFHRVVKDFVVQGGDPTGTGEGDPRISSIRDEYSGDAAHNRNEKYTVAMAKTSLANSATSQFFFNLKYNSDLDNKYSVFGKVTVGMDVVDAMGNVAVNGEKPVDDLRLIKAILVSG
jgi:peptidylprolyl isomerase